MASKVHYRHQKHDPKVVAALCEALIATSDPKKRSNSVGICSNVWQLVDGSLSSKQDMLFFGLLRGILRSWPEGVHPLCPVGGPQEYYEKYRNGTLWRNKRRLALLTYCLEEASKLKVK